MEGATIQIIVSIVSVGAVLGIGLATLIVTTTGRLGTRLTSVEKESARIVGLIEGLGWSGRAASKTGASE